MRPEPVMDASVFSWTLAGKIADEAWLQFNRPRVVDGVDVCYRNSDGAVFCNTYDTDHWTRVGISGAKPASNPGPNCTWFAHLSGFFTREQWLHQLHNVMGRLPILTEANGWTGLAPSKGHGRYSK